MEFSHYPVMLSECIEGLDIKSEGIYVDCTAGGGGHSEEILKRLTSGKLISIDQDDEALEACKKRFEKYKGKSILVKSNFSELDSVLNNLDIDHVDGVIMDLGVSSHQLDTPERGFSYNSDAELDMRMNPLSPFSAYDVVNSYSEFDLKRIIRDYGEEKFASIIARKIVNERERSPIKSTLELANIIRSSIPVAAAKKEAQHPAKRTFQAIRIEVNHELDVIEPAIHAAVKHLNDGGRIVIMTFHSLEDRLVKTAFNQYAQGCTCPKDFPVCVCGNKPKLKIITKKPITASEKELNENSRSKCAKLRIAEKL
ncbi:MAG: 16S rRNA (cytosine(1402)-N(4))-methyltransferase RsmH [Clostridia bacterium]|nr:16S rRNA (cytosine(1402)-N(4))-methyltransferase RsmH [Clostridia bacterium]MBQ7788082.1 16S rRNA (cytosine(1402)-N(4))-methyltransferase RsmH [Clostridia bacterium]